MLKFDGRCGGYPRCVFWDVEAELCHADGLLILDKPPCAPDHECHCPDRRIRALREQLPPETVMVEREVIEWWFGQVYDPTQWMDYNPPKCGVCLANAETKEAIVHTTSCPWDRLRKAVKG